MPRSPLERASIKIGAVINDASGTLSPRQAENRLEEIKRHLKARVSHGCLAIVPGGQVRREIERLRDLGVNVLIVGGGDGTISTAASLLADTEIALAVLALGTKNHFARDLGIPTGPVEAIGLLDQLNVQQIDLGEVNGHLFINNATLGLYPKIVEQREEKRQKPGWRKWSAQIAAALIVLWRIPKIRLTVEEKDGRTGYKTPFLFVGNNEYQGRLMFDSHRSTLSGGNLWLCAAHASGMMSLLHMAWQLRTRGIQGIVNIETRFLKEVTIYSMRRRERVAVDGENLKIETPLRFNIRRKSLRVVVP
ncbi:MAG: diacylglycerol kinase family protein [Balneolales bacterium]